VKAISDRRRAKLVEQGITNPYSTLLPKSAKTPDRPSSRRYVNTGPVRDVVEVVYVRAQHSCELCQAAVGPIRGVDHHIHHRRPRRAGGSSDPATNWASNLLLLCPTCHDVVESRRTAAYANGWLLRASDNPATVAVLIWRGSRWVYLNDTDRYSDLPPELTA
jgi:5-methylcytosine-specific restriction protein A